MAQTTRWVSRIVLVAAFFYAMWYVYSNWIGRTPMRFGHVTIHAAKGQAITIAEAMGQYTDTSPGASGYPGTITIHHTANNHGQYVVDWSVKGKEYTFDWVAAGAKAANANAKLMMKSVRR